MLHISFGISGFGGRLVLTITTVRVTQRLTNDDESNVNLVIETTEMTMYAFDFITGAFAEMVVIEEKVAGMIRVLIFDLTDSELACPLVGDPFSPSSRRPALRSI